ncbi:MAG: hypothetical protein AAB557_04820 [Patescibacteria group bacterium]
MFQPYRSVWWLFVGISGISALAWFINVHAPDSWQVMLLFFILITAIIISLLLYFIDAARHIFLITGGLLILLTLRFFGLREIIYPILLIASLLSVELLLRKR